MVLGDPDASLLMRRLTAPPRGRPTLGAGLWCACLRRCCLPGWTMGRWGYCLLAGESGSTCIVSLADLYTPTVQCRCIRAPWTHRYSALCEDGEIMNVSIAMALFGIAYAGEVTLSAADVPVKTKFEDFVDGGLTISGGGGWEIRPSGQSEPCMSNKRGTLFDCEGFFDGAEFHLVLDDGRTRSIRMPVKHLSSVLDVSTDEVPGDRAWLLAKKRWLEIETGKPEIKGVPGQEAQIERWLAGRPQTAMVRTLEQGVYIARAASVPPPAVDYDSAWVEGRIRDLRRPGNGTVQLVIDTTGDFPELQDLGGALMEPNTSVLVYAIYAANRKVKLSGTGARGLSEGVVLTSKQDIRNFGSATEVPNTDGYRIAVRQFGPRVAGGFDVTVVLYEADYTTEVDRITAEFEVEKRYRAAVRVGVGALFAPNDRTYAIATAPGGSQAEVVGTQLDPSFPAHMEIVLGFAAFPNRGGRGYAVSNLAPLDPSRLAPYVGLGVVGTGASNPLSTLRSLYLGAEWEVSKGASIAIAGVVRRVESLSDLYVLGGPIDPSLTTVPTKSGYAPGIGLVVNFSPEFLTVARKGVGP